MISAYLLGELEEDAYLEPPDSLNIPQGKVLKAVKGLPGLKQLGRTWNQKITAFFEEHRLKSLPANHSIFVNKEQTLIVALYVDNLLLFSPMLEKIQPL